MTTATAVAFREITAPITQDHINRGAPGECGECPIALGILDAIPGAWRVEVFWAGGDGEPAETGAAATIWLEQGTLHGRLGGEADAFIPAFDRGEHVEPFTLTITIPEGAAA